MRKLSVTKRLRLFLLNRRVKFYEEFLRKKAPGEIFAERGVDSLAPFLKKIDLLYKFLYVSIAKSHAVIENEGVFNNPLFDNIKLILNKNPRLVDKFSFQEKKKMLRLAVINYDPRILIYLLLNSVNPSLLIKRCSLLAVSEAQWGGTEDVYSATRVLLYFGAYDKRVIAKLLKSDRKRAILLSIMSSEDDVFAPSSFPRMPESSECVDDSSNYERFIKTTMSFSDYIRFALYSSIGFYTNEISFGRYATGGDFVTPSTASLGVIYAKKFFEFAFEVWKRKKHKLREGSFFVLEIGCGDGAFARNFLTEARGEAKKDLQCGDFYSSLRYVMLDISNRLRCEQWKNTREFSEKVDLFFCDAERGELDDKAKFLYGKVSLVITNELLDAFPPHKFKCEGEVKTCFVVPYLLREKLEGVEKYRDIEKNSKEYANFLREFFEENKIKGGVLGEDIYPLMPDDFKKIFVKNEKIKDYISFSEVFISAANVPCCRGFLKKKNHIFPLLKKDDFVLLQELRPYVALLKRLVDPRLFCAVNVDYGAENSINHEIRTYAKRAMYDDNNLYTFPGKKDVTYDNSFAFIMGELQKAFEHTVCMRGKIFVMNQYLLISMSDSLRTPSVLERLVLFGSRVFLGGDCRDKKGICCKLKTMQRRKGFSAEEILELL